MSLHTTTTALFSLTKYSRSYGGSATHSQLAAENEWQHFTNPVMKLLLEVKKSPSSGELLSLRLRILWCIDMQAVDTQVDQREVVFEDLELLSFSSLSASRAPNGSEQGLPLRAVYRDAVVGIRYLHPKTVPPGCQPVYRRFQVTFGSILEASQFIDTIKPICPCKPNAQPNQMTRNSTMLARAGLGRTSTISDAMPSERPMPPNEPVFKPATNYRSMTGIQMSPTRSGWQSSGISSTTLSSEDNGFVICSKAHYLPDSQRKELGAVNSSNPSSQPHSANHNSNMVPPLFVPRNLPRSTEVPAPSPAATESIEPERPDLLSSLGTHPSLYNLSQPDLERLISQVVREEGFARLLDGLDALWRAKGFLAR
ncbi:hypothetical protein EDD16DRAFT_1492858 [Pisolithus croceorrhizus]|nr:hypothetical protein EDD16DRAFT_1492858 [Pisolithus croceorrhizus]